MGHLHQSKGDLEDVALSRKVQKASHYATRPLCAVLEEGLLLLAVITQTRHRARFTGSAKEKSLRKSKISGRPDDTRRPASQKHPVLKTEVCGSFDDVWI